MPGTNSASPIVEIFVYGERVEGIHLRHGKISRGGIRWSDRYDDYRNEILGLMKAQMLKNTLIVPDGSKGGFVLRTYPGEIFSIQEMKNMGREAYRSFITALLSVTDNLSMDGQAILPLNVTVLDEPDPYLVVAADKGTASFSDLANELAQRQNYWLNDAFASGGSYGYDHKKQGITAKGAWESVKRHFLEMGRDPHADSITVIGIGDMSGDVFGNGMLLSQSLRLIAAFNHHFIFIDPDPDPERSFFERKRLFEKGADWNDYDTSLISSGGGIYDRDARSIEIPLSLANTLGVKARQLSGLELIRALLLSPVDLIWNGGIGTYIKAEEESHFEVLDPANDRVRVNARELHCSVIAEGGNLGVTRRGRVEAAEHGVRLNTDAVDNSGGVDMSDHEVNLKILLDMLLRKGKISSFEERNQLIRQCEDFMIEHVLSHNRETNLMLSLDEIRSAKEIPYYRGLIRWLSREDLLNRKEEAIVNETRLDQLESQHQPLSRPNLATLLGYVRMAARNALETAPSLEEDYYLQYLYDYFPPVIHKQFPDEVVYHPLRKHIISSMVVNRIIHDTGILYFHRLVIKTGCSIETIVRVTLHLYNFLNILHYQNIAGLIPDQRMQAKYEYLIYLANRVENIVQLVLAAPEETGLLTSENYHIFSDILNESASLSDLQLSAEYSNFNAYLQADQDSGNLTVYRACLEIEAMGEAIEIFTARLGSGKSWDTAQYFNILSEFRIGELRNILTTYGAHSSWEDAFFTRIAGAIRTLVHRILELSQADSEIKLQIRNNVTQIVRMHDEKRLSPAAFYEILIQSLEIR